MYPVNQVILPPIVFTGQTEAGKALCHKSFGPTIRYIISIGDEADAVPEGYETSQASKLRLVFDDVEFSTLPAGYAGCTQDDIASLIEFCHQIKEQPGTTLVHCAAGISRSSASVLVLLAVLLGPHREQEAVEHLLAIRVWSAEQGFRDNIDIIFPNRRIIALADQHLQREGRLLRACLNQFSYGWHPDFDSAP